MAKTRAPHSSATPKALDPANAPFHAHVGAGGPAESTPPPPPPKPPPPPPPPPDGRASLELFLGRGESGIALGALAAELRALPPAQRALLAAAVPYPPSGSPTAGRCAQLRALFEGLAKEKPADG